MRGLDKFMVNFLRRVAAYSCCAAISLTTSSLLLPQNSIAQSNSGFILFGNVKDNALEYVLDYGRANQGDRYYLDLPAQKFKVAQVLVTYPESFNGEFDPDRMDLRINDRNVPLESAKWDKENRRIEVIPKEPIPANKKLKLVLSNVRNPNFGGLYQFDARVLGSDDLPMLRYVGSWVIGID